MNTKPRPAWPGGALHVAHTPTANDPDTLILSDAEQLPDAVTRLDRIRVQRRDRVGGVIHEYRLVA